MARPWRRSDGVVTWQRWLGGLAGYKGCTLSTAMVREGIKKHHTQRLNSIPLIPAGMPQRQMPIALSFNKRWWGGHWTGHWSAGVPLSELQRFAERAPESCVTCVACIANSHHIPNILFKMSLWKCLVISMSIGQGPAWTATPPFPTLNCLDSFEECTKCHLRLKLNLQ